MLTPVALVCLWAGGWLWAALIAVGALGLAWEWANLCRFPPAWRGAAYVALGLAWAAAAPRLWPGMRPPVELAVSAVVVWLISRRLDLAAGVFYAGFGVLALLWLRADPAAGRLNVLFVLLIVWASDIGAYLSGRLIGGAKLAPAISPGKTWSGALGGLLAGMIAGAVVAGGASLAAIAIAAGLCVFSEAGDLLESALKRRFGVKDSGRSIPGHGGLFDRLDGVLAAAPAAAALAWLQGHGGALWQ